MKNLIKLAFITFIALAANMGALSAQDDNQGKVYLIEEIYLFDELDYAFYQSYNAFLSGQDARAGARLKRAAYFVRLEANEAKTHNKKPIEKQANRLMALSDSIALGKINSAARLRRAYSRTHHVLAQDYKLRAAGFWAGEKAEQTGHAMIAAVGHLGHAAKWTGRKVEQGVVGTGNVIGSAGKAVGKGAVSTGKAVGKGAVSAGKAVGKGTVSAGKAVGKGTVSAGKAVGKGTASAGRAVGEGAATAGVESYRGVRWLAGKMIRGVAFVPEKVGQGLEWLGKSIDNIGEDVEPNPRPKKSKKEKE